MGRALFCRGEAGAATRGRRSDAGARRRYEENEREAPRSSAEEADEREEAAGSYDDELIERREGDRGDRKRRDTRGTLDFMARMHGAVSRSDARAAPSKTSLRRRG
jgi:hypothetical protein